VVDFYQLVRRSATIAYRVRRDPALGSFGVSPEDIVAVADIATMLGVGIATAHRYANRGGFPEPLGQASSGRVWLRADVEKWGKAHLPLPTGRPRKQKPR
jgi:predicted DNA-binding transcriptional regulator AlpA